MQNGLAFNCRKPAWWVLRIEFDGLRLVYQPWPDLNPWANSGIEPEVRLITASEYHRHTRGRLCNSHTPIICDRGHLFVNPFRMLGKV